MDEAPSGTTRIVDVASLALVPVVLGSTFLLPEPTRLDLALAYTEPTLTTAFTMHFVHLSPGHLLTNVVAYLLIVPLAYALALRAGRLDLYRAALVVFLLVLPLVLSGLNLLLSRPRIGFGFSGINMAFLGLLPLLIVAFLERRAPGSIAIADAPVLFFAGAGLVAGLAVPDSTTRLAIVGLAVCSALLYVRDRRTLWRLRDGLRSVLGSDDAELAAAALVVFALLSVAAFPADLTSDGTVLNIYSHLLGYCIGFIAPFATAVILDVGPPREGGTAETLSVGE